MTSYFRFVLRHRLAVVLVCLAITGLAVAATSRAVVASSVEKMFFGDSPRYAAYRARARQFGSDELLVVAYDDPDPLSPDSLDRLTRAAARIEKLAEVARVHSLLGAQRVWSDNESLQVESYADAARARPGRRAELLARLTRDERHAGVLVSRDGKHAAILVELTVKPDRKAEQVPRLLEAVAGALHGAGFEPSHLHYTGIPPLMSTVVAETYANLKRLFPLSAAALLLTVLMLFRRLAPALLATGIALVADAWTIGFASLLDRELNILISLAPAVVLVVSFSDVIHLWSAYQIELKEGKDRRQAILASATDVGTACLLTSATTFVGFLCLSLIPTPMFRQMGIVLGFGVAVALLLAMTLVPVALSFMPARLTARPPSEGLGRFLDRLARLCTRRPWTITAGFAVILAATILGLTGLDIDTDLSQRLSEQSTYRRDQRYFERNFGGTTMVTVYVDTKEAGGLLEPRVFHAVDALERRLCTRPEVDRADSLVTLMRTLHHTITGERGLPDSRQALAQYLLLFEMSGGEHLDQFVDFKRRSMRVLFRTRQNAVRATHETGLAAGRIGRDLLGQHATVEPTGFLFLIGWWLDAIIEGQRNGLMLSFAIIAVMMMLGLRSLRIGLLSMIPNLLPLLALGAYLGVTRDAVDSDAMAIGIMALGIGVDDTIHFLMRYRIESARGRDRDEAIRRTFAFSGRAILLTTVVLVAGFVPFTIGDYLTTRMMGTMLPGVLAVALLADLLLVPALVRLGPLAVAPRRGGSA